MKTMKRSPCPDFGKRSCGGIQLLAAPVWRLHERKVKALLELLEQSKVVTEESTFEYLDNVPSSECWFSDCVNGNYGPKLVGFETREEFERFIEFTRVFREDRGLSFEEFIKSDLLESLFDEESEVFRRRLLMSSLRRYGRMNCIISISLLGNNIRKRAPENQTITVRTRKRNN